MKRSQLVIAALTFSSVGAFAAANDSSSQSYTSAISSDNSQVSQIQQALNDKGFNVGPVDGNMGPKTKTALKQFQQAQGLQASGKLDQQTVAALTIKANAPGAASEMSTTSTPSTSSPSTTSNPSTPDSPSASSSTGNPGFSPQSAPPAQGK